MVNSADLYRVLRAAGFNAFTGVPCSLLTSFLTCLQNDTAATHIPATNEGDAVAVACGLHLGGARPVVYLQNSGLGNAVNPLASLADAFQVPLLLVIGWRGEPSSGDDAPQHRLTGEITPGLLDLLKIRWTTLPRDVAELNNTVACLSDGLAGQRSQAILVPRGGNAGAEQPASVGGASKDLLTPVCLIRALLKHVRTDDILISTTGYTSRDLGACSHRPLNLYVVGAMGCASSLALGLAARLRQRRIIVLDGDGSVLMRMGAMAAIGASRPGKLIHIVLNNGLHESTGGQAVANPSVHFRQVAIGCGYARAVLLSQPESLGEALALQPDGATLVEVRVGPRSSEPSPRPSGTPLENKRRFCESLAAGRAADL